MTKHNLRDHLGWLLNRGPSLYPSLDLVGNNSSGNPGPDRCPPGQSAALLTEVPTDTVSNSNPVEPTTRLNAAPSEEPTIEQSGSLNGYGSTVTTNSNMARLQFAPQSTSKPRMLSCVNGASTPKTPSASARKGHQARQTHTSSQGQTKGTSVTIYAGQLLPLLTCYVVDKSDGTPTRRTDRSRKTPSYREESRFNFPSPLADIDSIDLTGDLGDQDSSSATVETFGEPRAIWRKDSASRTEPLVKRGRKRKSDEYKSDLKSPKISGSRVKSIPARAPTEDPDSFVAIDDFDDLEFHDAPTGQTSSIEKEARDGEESRQERTIFDSEDDDIYDEVVIHDEIDDPSTRMEIDNELYPKLPDREVAGPEEDPNRSSSSENDRNSETGKFLKPSSSASAIQRNSPAKSARKCKQYEGSSLSNRYQQSSPGESKQISTPRSFPVSSSMFDRLEKLSREYKEVVNRNAEIIYERAIQGLSEPSLLDRNKALNDKLLAIKQLYSEKEAYDLCLRKNEELKGRILQGLKYGDHAVANSADMDESRKLVEELQKRETTAHGLLQCIGVFDSNRAEAAINTPPQYTLVAGTQMPAFGSEPVKKDFRSATVDDAGSLSYPTRPGPNTVPRNRTVDLPHDGSQNSPLKSYRPSSPSRSNPTHVTRSRPGPSSYLESNFGSVSGDTVHNTIPEEDDFMWDEDDDIFSRNMGSATVSGFDNGDFDDDADDSDLLEAAQNFENRQFLTTKDYRSHDRQVFSETSGNINRAPLANKTSDSYPESFTAPANHPWSNDVRTALTTRFHLRGFRHNQLEAIDATLSGKDTFVLMPTGGGKSLCYQLPSVISSGRTRGVTIVISPLLSLMQDQVAHLKKLHIRATMINGEVTGDERKEILRTLHGSRAEEKIQLLYVTPEMVSKSGSMMNAFRSLRQNGKLARIVIDEAHCVSQWGHDFRPDYKMLGEVRGEFPGVPVMALTATATENVKIDIIHNLGIPNCKVFTQSFNRPNLTYEVLKKSKGMNILAGIAEIIKTKYKRQSGIVYCLSRMNCEKVAKRLREEHGVSAAHYHAGMEPQERASVQKDWQSGISHVIVATIAFGMGIDKPDVRFVIHHTMPMSLEGYYQETGRAGRDGKLSGCYLYYGFQDTSSLRQMIKKNEGSVEQKHRQHQMLRNVVQFSENMADCRRVQILAYFNERFQKENCKRSCDNCKSPGEFVNQDFTEHAKMAIKLVRSYIRMNKQKNDNKEEDEEATGHLTLHYCADLFRGQNPRKLPERDIARLDGYGGGSEFGKGDIQRLFQRLLLEDALAEDNKVNKRGFTLNYITLGYRADEFARGQHTVKFLIRVSEEKPDKAPKKNNSAGARAAGDEHPESTNVPSPVQSMSRRRLQRSQVRNPGIADSDEDEEFDGFGPIREAGGSDRRDSHDLGPPITNDEKMGNLDFIQKIVLDYFLEKAKKECSQVS